MRTADNVSSPKNGQRASGQGFFAIDSRIWERVGDWGSQYPAAYLVLACGTGHDNVRTSWSTQAVMKHAGLGWQRAKLAVEGLIEDGFLRRAASHTESKPRYEIATFPEWTRFQCAKCRDEKPGSRDLALLSAIEAGEQPKTEAQVRRAWRMAENDELWRDREGRYFLPSEIPEDSSDYLIWLPNTIVTGTSKGAESPIRRLRSAEPLTAMELFVSLYSEHNLSDDGGVSPNILAMKFERKKIARIGGYVIWGFREVGLSFHWHGLSVAKRWRYGTKDERESRAKQNLRLLEDLGLLSFVPHIYDSAHGEPIHVYGVGEIGEAEIERKIGDAARSAANAMVSAEVRERANAEGFRFLCPVHYSKNAAQLIGIGRLTCRPHTSRTARWSEGLQRNGPAWIGEFNALELRQAENTTSKRHQRGSMSVKSINGLQEYQWSSTTIKERKAVEASAL